mgnify:CR=1 FL=1
MNKTMSVMMFKWEYKRWIYKNNQRIKLDKTSTDNIFIKHDDFNNYLNNSIIGPIQKSDFLTKYQRACLYE